MLEEGRRRAEAAGIRNVRWVEAVAEDIGRLDLGRFRLVTFGQSFHRVDRLPVAETVYNSLEPGGAIAMVSHADVDTRPRPSGPDYPAVPNDEVHELIRRYIGEPQILNFCPPTTGDERWEVTIAKTSFGTPRILHAPGVADFVRDVDSVVANYYSMSYAAPPLFGEAREEYEAELRRLLWEHSPEGLFWDWPGDTEIVVAVKS
jgi:hypothetical protein